MMTSAILVIIHLILTCLLESVLGTKCYRNEAVGDRDGNVYYCEDPNKPECCEENQEFVCCESQSSKTLKEQFILWGAVLAAVIIIAVLVCWLFKDYNCCSSEQTVRERCCSCCRKRDDSDTQSLSTEEYHNKRYNYHVSPFTKHFPPDEELKIRPGTTSGNTDFYY